jgi:hypothetical protein
LPVKVLSKLFRGKFTAGLERLQAKGQLELPAPLQRPGAFSALLAQLRRTRWVTYCKRPVRRARAGVQVPRPLHTPGRSLEQATPRGHRRGRDHRDKGRQDRDDGTGRVHPSVPEPRSANRIREDPALRARRVEQRQNKARSRAYGHLRRPRRARPRARPCSPGLALPHARTHRQSTSRAVVPAVASTSRGGPSDFRAQGGRHKDRRQPEHSHDAERLRLAIGDGTTQPVCLRSRPATWPRATAPLRACARCRAADAAHPRPARRAPPHHRRGRDDRSRSRLRKYRLGEIPIGVNVVGGLVQPGFGSIHAPGPETLDRAGCARDAAGTY